MTCHVLTRLLGSAQPTRCWKHLTGELKRNIDLSNAGSFLHGVFNGQHVAVLSVAHASDSIMPCRVHERRVPCLRKTGLCCLFTITLVTRTR